MKKFIWIAVGIVVLVGGVFYSGMRYGTSVARTPGTGMERFAGGLGGVRGGQQGSSIVSGDILNKDATSVTVKLRDGGSKIVFFSDTTEISRFASGSATDLTVGQSVTVSGKTNTDGSVTAQSIQLRPAIPDAPGRSSDK